MPIPAYMKISDFPGSVVITGREETIEVLGFDHDIYIPTDRREGKAAGTRVHGQFKIYKNFDKSTPELYKYLCNGKRIPEITLNWYDIVEGDEVIYFTHTLTDAKISRIRAYMPDVDDPVTEQFKHREEISMSYEKITWKFIDGNIEFADSWKDGR